MNEEIILGLGGTVDYELSWDIDTFQTLIDKNNIFIEELENAPSSIRTVREILLAVLYSMKNNIGSEYFVKTAETLISYASNFVYKVTLGGTGVRAALALEKVNIHSTVHLVSICDQIRELLPKDISYLSSAKEDSIHPHVIIQYPDNCAISLKNARIRTRRPNRVILVNDPPNEELSLAKELHKNASKCKIFVISGFNSMKSEMLIKERLFELEEILSHLPASSKVIFEDAGYHSEKLRKHVIRSASKWADIYSMNEDEAQEYYGKKINLESPEELYQMLTFLREHIKSKNIVVHTAHYAAVIGEDVEYALTCADFGCIMASTRFAFGDNFSVEEFLHSQTCPRNPIGLFIKASPMLNNIGIGVAPSYLVESDHPTTIGLGDSFVGGMVYRMRELFS